MMKKNYFKRMVVALMIAGTCFSGTGFMIPAPAARAMEMETVKTKEADAVEDIYDEIPTEVTKKDDRYEIKGPGIIGSVIDETAGTGTKAKTRKSI